MGLQDIRDPLEVASATPTTAGAAEAGSLRDPLSDPLAMPVVEMAAPAEVAAPVEDLPLVPLPSAFKPERFLAATRARGARPEALKVLDQHLVALDATPDPRDRFERLKVLQVDVDQFVLRYRKDNARKKAVLRLKTWVDGAIKLRAAAFA
jgi:hypothetical protein